MVKKFHINKHGEPARCYAKDGNCPLKQSAHYNTYAEAQDAANKMNEEKYGILPENKNRNGISVSQPKRKKDESKNRNGIPVSQPKRKRDESKNRNGIPVSQPKRKRDETKNRNGIPVAQPKRKYDETKSRNGIPVAQPKRKHFNSSENKSKKIFPIESNEFVTATTEAQLNHIESRLLEMSNEGPNAFYHRCRKSEKVHTYVPKNYVDTEHFEKDRTFRSERILKTFGEGKLVGYYKVTQEVGTKIKELRTQMIEIRDTGQLIAYDMNSGRKITTFIAQPKRIELMMIKAGDIPNKALLEKMEKNKREAYIKKIND